MGGDDDTIKLTIEVTWKHTIVLLVGSILSFADPITDILTLREFYRTDHKVWFGVGLTFVILPSLVFSVLYWMQFKLNTISAVAEVAIFGCNPFSVAFARLRGFLLCFKNFKKLWRKEELDADCQNEIKHLLFYATWSAMFEAVLESAPQFLIQLYAMNIQEEPISVIQIISSIVSFLSLAWTFIIADEWRLLSLDRTNLKIDIGAKVKAVLYVSQLFLLSGRLFAITYFTVTFKWWIILVLMIHSIFMSIARCSVDCGNCRGRACVENCVKGPVALFFYWIRDDGSSGITVSEKGKTLKRIQLVSNILFVIENLIMISMYYRAEESHAWYSLPLTVCVCLFSFFGGLMRAVLLRFLL